MNITTPDKINPGDVIAVGDIHARYDLLDEFLKKVANTQAVVIFLGDIIDRGGQDIQVVERIRKLTEDPESEGLSNVFCLMGNHENMFIDACEGPFQSSLSWLQNGGNFEQMGDLQEHLEWFQQLPIYMTIGDTLFIHAGCHPGKDPIDAINKGRTESLLWMREPFLTYGPEFEKWNPELKLAVFGHTPQFAENGGEEGAPYTIPQGLCIDTGAYWTDTLTAYNATRNEIYQVKVTIDEATIAAG